VQVPSKDPEERAMIAQIAARSRWAKTPDRSGATSKARSSLRTKFEREADPDGTLSPAEREYRVEQLMKAHMLRMTLKAKQARRAAREARDVSGTSA
jgi:hypothetical protein